MGCAAPLAALGRRWLALDTEARELEKQIAALLTAHAPQLLARHGVGAVTAAQLLITAGANPERLRGDAALAALCGASPVEASSGKTSRHRLNRGATVVRVVGYSGSGCAIAGPASRTRGHRDRP